MVAGAGKGLEKTLRLFFKFSFIEVGAAMELWWRRMVHHAFSVTLQLFFLYSAFMIRSSLSQFPRLHRGLTT
jgi:hypothetical protein